MAKLHYSADSIESQIVDSGNKKQVEVKLTLTFLSEGDMEEFIHQNGAINHYKIDKAFTDLINSAKEIEL